MKRSLGLASLVAISLLTIPHFGIAQVPGATHDTVDPVTGRAPEMRVLRTTAVIRPDIEPARIRMHELEATIKANPDLIQTNMGVSPEEFLASPEWIKFSERDISQAHANMLVWTLLEPAPEKSRLSLDRAGIVRRIREANSIQSPNQVRVLQNFYTYNDGRFDNFDITGRNSYWNKSLDSSVLEASDLNRGAADSIVRLTNARDFNTNGFDDEDVVRAIIQANLSDAEQAKVEGLMTAGKQTTGALLHAINSGYKNDLLAQIELERGSSDAETIARKKAIVEAAIAKFSTYPTEYSEYRPKFDNEVAALRILRALDRSENSYSLLKALEDKVSESPKLGFRSSDFENHHAKISAIPAANIDYAQALAGNLAVKSEWDRSRIIESILENGGFAGYSPEQAASLVDDIGSAKEGAGVLRILSEARQSEIAFPNRIAIVEAIARDPEVRYFQKPNIAQFIFSNAENDIDPKVVGMLTNIIKSDSDAFGSYFSSDQQRIFRAIVDRAAGLSDAQLKLLNYFFSPELRSKLDVRFRNYDRNLITNILDRTDLTDTEVDVTIARIEEALATPKSEADGTRDRDYLASEIIKTTIKYGVENEFVNGLVAKALANPTIGSKFHDLGRINFYDVKSGALTVNVAEKADYLSFVDSAQADPNLSNEAKRLLRSSADDAIENNAVSKRHIELVSQVASLIPNDTDGTDDFSGRRFINAAVEARNLSENHARVAKAILDIGLENMKDNGFVEVDAFEALLNQKEISDDLRDVLLAIIKNAELGGTPFLDTKAFLAALESSKKDSIGADTAAALQLVLDRRNGQCFARAGIDKQELYNEILQNPQAAVIAILTALPAERALTSCGPIAANLVPNDGGFTNQIDGVSSVDEESINGENFTIKTDPSDNVAGAGSDRKPTESRGTGAY